MAMSTRDAYGHVLETEIYKNPDVVVVDADIASSTRAEKFKNKAPERFFNVGISEQDLMGTAAGLASAAGRPGGGIGARVWLPSEKSPWPDRMHCLPNGDWKSPAIPSACPISM